MLLELHSIRQKCDVYKDIKAIREMWNVTAHSVLLIYSTQSCAEDKLKRPYKITETKSSILNLLIFLQSILYGKFDSKTIYIGSL